MASARRLPYPSPRGVFQAFLEILDADSDTVFTQRSLRAKGIQQYRQILTLLRFLDLLSGGGRLEHDVLENTYDAERLKKLLLARLRSGCLDAGCEPDQIAFLNRGNSLGRSELDKQLRTLPPIAKQKAAELRSSMLSCLRALYQILVQSNDDDWRNWLKKECIALQRVKRIAQQPPDPATDKKRLTGKQHDLKRTVDGSSEPDQISDIQTVWRLPPADPAEGRCELERITVGFTEEDDPIHAYISFDIPPNGEYLKRLGKSILRAARDFDPCDQSRSPEA